VSTLSPADNAVAVAAAANLVIVFSESMQKGTGNIVLKAGAATVQTIPVTDASVTVSGATVTINPSADFTSGAAINVEIAAGALEDLSGNDYAGIAGATTWNFTVLDVTAPTLTSLLPADNAINVGSDANLIIVLSEAVQKGTGNIIIKESGITTQTIPVTDAAVSVSGSTVTINPGDFTTGAAVNVELTAGVIKDLANNNYAGITTAVAWNFTVATVPVPAITSVAPGAATIGSQVVITGTNFSGTPSNNSVMFNGSSATVISSSSTTITVTVPDGATTGSITVTVAGMTGTSPSAFVVTPAISGFTPGNGVIGTAVTINGTGFDPVPANNQVMFNGVAATVNASTLTSISTNVPAGATTGKIAVTVGGETATSVTDFTVSTPTTPSVSGFLPTSGTPGTQITISGSNFSAVPANNLVKFNNVTATVTASSATSITTTVPAGATSGAITVTVGGETGTSGASFTVTLPSPFITGFTPDNGVTATSVTINGGNFSATSTGNTVRFNGTLATINGTPTTTSLVAIVPAEATTGKITIETIGGTATSTNDFIVTTSEPVAITSQSFPTSYNKGATLTVSITVSDASRVTNVNLKRKGISEAASALKTDLLTAAGNTYQKQIAATDLNDPIGITYYFEVNAQGQEEIESSTGNAYITFPSTSTDQILPDLTFGDEVINYSIIAVPLNLTNKNVANVFSALGNYDKTKWRLFDFANGDNREFPGFQTIDPGKGYWLIVRESKVINPGAGVTVQVDDNNPFEITLVPGWNLIGNPYNFRVSWTDILQANNNMAGVDPQLQLFSNGDLNDGVTLDRFRGGFAFNNGTSNVKVRVPPTRNTALGGRTSATKTDLTSGDWEVRLTLTDGVLSNHIGGIGMNPNATVEGKDQFDVVRLPFPDGLSLFDITIDHPELKTQFTRDVVPPRDEFIWEMNVHNLSQGTVKMTWPIIATDERRLVLFDPATLVATEMTDANEYVLSSATTKLFALFGGEKFVEENLNALAPMAGAPFPNPSHQKLSIPFRVDGIDVEQVTIQAYNSSGTLVRTLTDGYYEHGAHSVSWQHEETAGLYLVKVSVGAKKERIFKVIIK
jgi:hypothetical protein